MGNEGQSSYEQFELIVWAFDLEGMGVGSTPNLEATTLVPIEGLVDS